MLLSSLSFTREDGRKDLYKDTISSEIAEQEQKVSTLSDFTSIDNKVESDDSELLNPSGGLFMS